MGRALYEAFESVRELFQRSDELANRKLSRLCFEGPMEELTSTINAQPCIYMVSYSIFMLLSERGLHPDYVAGHSLGEWTAGAAAGFYDFETGLQLVLKRAELMNDAPVGAMAAIIGCSEREVLELCKRAGEKGIIVTANFNSPKQIVLSGERPAIEEAVRLAREFGAQRAVMLRVSGAFHSPLMKPVQVQLAQMLMNVQFHNARIPLVANVTARPVQDGSTMKDLMVKQLTAPVRWVESIRWLWAHGVRTFVEIGPRKILSQLVRQTIPEACAIQVDTPDGLEAVTATLMP